VFTGSYPTKRFNAGAQLKRTAHPVLFQTISKREILRAVPILSQDSEHRISFHKVIYPMVEKVVVQSPSGHCERFWGRENLFVFDYEW
jgi:hypothetical protein